MRNKLMENKDDSFPTANRVVAINMKDFKATPEMLKVCAEKEFNPKFYSEGLIIEKDNEDD